MLKYQDKKISNFPKGIFYKPEKIINFTNNLTYKNFSKVKKNNFKININKKSYIKIFSKLKKKLKVVKLIKLRFAQNTKLNQK